MAKTMMLEQLFNFVDVSIHPVGIEGNALHNSRIAYALADRSSEY